MDTKDVIIAALLLSAAEEPEPEPEPEPRTKQKGRHWIENLIIYGGAAAAAGWYIGASVGWW